jgi:hypothetical protein
MVIQQLSVFLENRSGRLTEVTEALGAEGINISAFSIAETSEYGVLRMVVSEPAKALEVLRTRRFSVSLTDVLCLSTPNEPGSLHRALRILSEAGISVDYMYAFAMGERALVVIRTESVERAIETLRQNQLTLLSASELYAF